jgi:hypothetical protein
MKGNKTGKKLAFLKPGSSNGCVFITEQGSRDGGVHDINLYQIDCTVLGE